MFSFQGELILAVTYGYQVQGYDDRLLNVSRGRIRFALEKVLPGTLLLNYVSFRVYFCLFHSQQD